MIFLSALLAATLAGPVAPPSPTPSDNLLRGPARCVLRYLDAVRLAGPRATEITARRPIPVREQAYAAARRLTAPKTLEEIAARASRGEEHPLAPWQEARRGAVLESFQLLAVRRAPRGTAVVTVRERWWSAPGGPGGESLARTVSEYLAARVEGEWRVVDRRAGGRFDDLGIRDGYPGWFDAAPPVSAAALPTSGP